MYDLHTITMLRRSLAENAGQLRAAQDRLGWVDANARQRILDAAGGPKALGSNETERKIAIEDRLGLDAEYLKARADVRGLEAERDKFVADLDAATDERRHDEWLIRLRLIDALEGAAVHQDDGRPGEDVAFDATADEALVESAITTTAETLAEPRGANGRPTEPEWDEDYIPF